MTKPTQSIGPVGDDVVANVTEPHYAQPTGETLKENESGPDNAEGTKSMADDIKAIKGERDALKAENKELHAEVKKLKEDFAQQQNTLHELMAKSGFKLKKEYVYGDDECRPVPLHGVCDKCGWVRDTQKKPGDDKKEPHPVV